MTPTDSTSTGIGTPTPTSTASPSNIIVFASAGTLVDSPPPSSAIPVSVPAGVQAGDTLITQIIIHDGTGSDVPGIPAGWNLLRHDSVNGSNLATSWLYYRRGRVERARQPTPGPYRRRTLWPV